MRNNWINHLFKPHPEWSLRASIILGMLIFVVLWLIYSSGAPINGWKHYAVVGCVALFSYYPSLLIEKYLKRKGW